MSARPGTEAPPGGLRHNRAFKLFYTSRTISSVGTGISMVVLPVLVYGMTGSPAATASLTVLETLPYLVFGMIAGAVADRADQRKVMITADMAAALLLGSIPATAAFHLLHAVQLFVVALGVATAFVFFDAASFSLFPSLIDRTQLATAGSMVWSASSVALLTGPAVGTSLILIMPAADVVGLDAATYLASAALIGSIRRPAKPAPGPGAHLGQVRSEIAAGLRFLWHQPVIRTMTLSVFAMCVSWGGMFSLLVVYASRALGVGQTGPRLGLLYSAGELGGLAAALLVPRVVRRRSAGRLAVAAMSLNAVCLLLLAAASRYAWAVLLFSGYEFTYTLILTVGITIRQLLTPDQLQGRVNTTARLIGYSGQPLGALLSGSLAELIPIRLVIVVIAVGIVAGTALAGWSCIRAGPLSAISIPAAGS